MADHKFYEQAVFTRRDLVELSGIPVASLKQYLTRGLIWYSDLNPPDRDLRKVRRFHVVETIRICIMGRLTKVFGIKPSASIHIADSISWGCVSAVQQEIWRNTGSDKRFWTAALNPPGKQESYPRRPGSLPHTVTAFWTNGDFAATQGAISVEWDELRDNTMGHIRGPEFAFAAIPDAYLWTEVIGPVLRRFEKLTGFAVPIPNDLRQLLEMRDLS